MLSTLDHLPEQFFTTPCHEFHKIFSGPVLIYLQGKIKKPLFISTLLHGNETTGVAAVKEILKESPQLPRSLILLFGNIKAARHGMRHLDNQPDYNRIWQEGPLPENKMALEVYEKVTAANPIACVDIHNNTGRNPFYSCFNRIEGSHLLLANLFSQTIVFFREPTNTLTVKMSEAMPSTVIECGKSDHPESRSFALSGLRQLLKCDRLDDLKVDSELRHYYEVIGKMSIAENVDFSFDEEPSDLNFDKNFDCNNFRSLIKGDHFANFTKNGENGLTVINLEGQDCTSQFFDYTESGELKVVNNFTPSMLTLQKKIIRQDCFGYLMLKRKTEDVVSR